MLFNQEVSGDLGKGSVWPSPCCPLPDPPSRSWKASEELMTKGQLQFRFHPLWCFPPSLFPSPPVWHPEVDVNVQELGDQLERSRRKNERPLDWAWEESLTQRLFSAPPTPTLCFLVLPSLSVSSCVMFLLVPWSALLSLRCHEGLFLPEGWRGAGASIVGRRGGGRGGHPVTEFVEIQNSWVWKCWHPF